MKFGFYSKLALDGIRKNKRLYLPYILTCIGMVCMYYILQFLQLSDAVRNIRGGDTIQYMLSYGVLLLALFSCIFLFYTNSFLMRRRMKEFGLYNILGMGKKNIGILICWETAFIFITSMVLGLLSGIVLSKLAELGITAIMEAETTFDLKVSFAGIRNTVLVFTVIFALILLNSLRRVWFSSTISLLKSETAGEKAPKANWFFGILGIVVLACAYYLAVNIEDPVSAIMWFFVAAVMVIVATYLIMISGSVLLCKILQKNKRYYYQAKHFVSVSSMTYRMKRNGAGLASICILATMVLVMVSSTFALYAGGEDSLNERFPRELNLSIGVSTAQEFSEDNISVLREDVEKLAAEHGTQMHNVTDYRAATMGGMMIDGRIETDSERAGDMGYDFSDVYQIFMIPLSDYNAMTGADKTLGPDEVLMYTNRQTLNLDQISFERGRTFDVKETLDEFFADGDMAMTIVSTVILVVDDVPAAVEDLVRADGSPVYNYYWKFGFDTDLNYEDEEKLFNDIRGTFIQSLSDYTRNFSSFSAESKNIERAGFIGMFGGLMYLGIILSIVFVFAAVLIIYYKQISEGYEDQSRFEIMQKVGMTKQEIRKSINSQLLTVFFLPLFGAGLHICFAYPIIEKLLRMFNMQNRSLFIMTTLGSFMAFALIYVIIYKVTSNAYYRIVSDARKSAA